MIEFGVALAVIGVLVWLVSIVVDGLAKSARGRWADEEVKRRLAQSPMMSRSAAVSYLRRSGYVLPRQQAAQPKAKPPELERWLTATAWEFGSATPFEVRYAKAPPAPQGMPIRASGEGDLSYARRLQAAGYVPRQFGVGLGPATSKATKRRTQQPRWH